MLPQPELAWRQAGQPQPSPQVQRLLLQGQLRPHPAPGSAAGPAAVPVSIVQRAAPQPWESLPQQHLLRHAQVSHKHPFQAP